MPLYWAVRFTSVSVCVMSVCLEFAMISICNQINFDSMCHPLSIQCAIICLCALLNFNEKYWDPFCVVTECMCMHIS